MDKSVYYLVNNYLPVVASPNVKIDFIIKDLKDFYEINVISITEIKKCDFDYYLQKQFENGATDFGVTI